MRWTRIWAMALCAAGCAHNDTKPAVSKKPIEGALVTAGSRCQSGGCTCRRVDDFGRSLEGAADVGAPAPGMKRFEVRTGRGLDPVSITVESRGTLAKSTTSSEPSCGYVDLPPGKHKVHLHAEATEAAAGMVPALFINEYSATHNSWYDTFQMRCGDAQGVCSEGHMRAWQTDARATPRGLFDACGSVRIEGIRWDGQRAPTIMGNAQLATLDVDLTLEVYKFEPRFPHGSPSCKAPTHEKPTE